LWWFGATKMCSWATISHSYNFLRLNHFLTRILHQYFAPGLIPCPCCFLVVEYNIIWQCNWGLPVLIPIDPWPPPLPCVRGQTPRRWLRCRVPAPMPYAHPARCSPRALPTASRLNTMHSSHNALSKHRNSCRWRVWVEGFVVGFFKGWGHGESSALTKWKGLYLLSDQKWSVAGFDIGHWFSNG
jgi:hypothetical protein